jgi:uncharacterized protein YfaS (alpha-2-macroglobulin family)
MAVWNKRFQKHSRRSISLTLAKAMAAPVYTVKNGESDFNPMTNVQQAIRKVESQQLFNGGMGMWPGATQEDWWATAYAVHFLEEARRAGFETNAKTISRALDYLTLQSGYHRKQRSSYCQYQFGTCL